MQEDKKIVEELIQATKDLKELNQRLSKSKYKIDDKEFETEEETREYIEQHIDKWFDFYLNDDMEDKIQQVFEDVEIYEEEIC